MTTTDEDGRATASADPHGLLIEADLRVGLPDAVIELHSEGDTLYVEAHSFAALAELRAAASSEAVDWLRQLGVESPLSIETPAIVRVRGVPVAHYIPSQRSGRLAALLGVSPLRVDLSGILQAAWRVAGD